MAGGARARAIRIHRPLVLAEGMHTLPEEERLLLEIAILSLGCNGIYTLYLFYNYY